MKPRNASDGLIVVDDDPVLLTLVQAQLGPLVSAVTVAADGVDGWAMLRERDFDLAVVDLDMPHFDGVSLTRCIRSFPKTQHIPVVILTSRDDQDAVRAALEAGATSYLIKPLNWSLFTSHVLHILELSGATRGQRADQSDAQDARVLDTVADVKAQAAALQKAFQTQACELDVRRAADKLFDAIEVQWQAMQHRLTDDEPQAM